MSNANSSPDLWHYYLLGFRLERGREPTEEELPTLRDNFENALPDIRHGRGRRPYAGELHSKKVT